MLFHIQTWIYGSSRKISHKDSTFGPHFHMRISSQWSLGGSCLLQSHVPPLTTAPPGLLLYITSPIWAPDGPEFADLESHTVSTTDPMAAYPLYFPFDLILLSPGSTNSLISIVPREQISSSFPIFFLLFQLNHSSSLPLSPSHPTEFPSQKLDSAFVMLKREARLSWSELWWHFFCEGYT